MVIPGRQWTTAAGRLSNPGRGSFAPLPAGRGTSILPVLTSCCFGNRLLAPSESGGGFGIDS